MKPISASLLALVAVTGTLPLACGSEAEPAQEERVAPAAEVALPLPRDSFSGPATEPADADAMPDRVYFVLTEFDWYARGEPIVLEGTSYTVDDDPIRIDARTMEHVVAYRGGSRCGSVGDRNRSFPGFDRFCLTFVPDPGTRHSVGATDTTPPGCPRGGRITLRRPPRLRP